MTGIDFLQPDHNQIRHQIRGILDSYSHDWDLLAELCQNSVDAIRLAERPRGHVQITVDASRGVLTCTDNGTGIKPDQVAPLLRPFGTDKYGNPNQIGEKGVGLTFVIFSSDDFSLHSAHPDGPKAVSIRGASSWLNASSPAPLLMTQTDDGQLDLGVKVSLTVPKDHPIFDLSFHQLIYLLRSRTALGDTGFIWKTPLNADFSVQHIDRSGKRAEKQLDCNYMLPIEAAPPADVVNIDSYIEWSKEQDRSDQEKRRRLLGKIVWSSGKKFQSGREIRYWSCFVPNRAAWSQLSASAKISAEEPPEEGMDFVPEYLNGFSGGLYTSTKGMPTGISIEVRPRGSAGYVPNFFILIDDPSLSFDIGRKAIQGRQQGMLRDIAYESFRDYINSVRKYMGGSVEESPSAWERDEIFDIINELTDLNSSRSRFVKRPNGQEATVAAMFFELIGSGVISDIRPLLSGYKGRYDLYAKWDRKNVVLEFKYDLAGLFKDFNDEKKMFEEVDAVVVWEVTERDLAQAKRRGIQVEKVLQSSLVKRSRFPSASYELHIENVKPLFAIELRPLLLEQSTQESVDELV